MTSPAADGDARSALSPREWEYVQAHQLGRLATVDAHGRPHVVPVVYQPNADGTIDIGGPKLSASQKFRDVEQNSSVAFVIDDMTPDDEEAFKPGVGRGVEIIGRAEALIDHDAPAVASEGFFSREVIRIHADRAVSWHVDPDQPVPRVLRGS